MDYEYYKILRNVNERHERYKNDLKNILTLNWIEGIHAVVPANWWFWKSSSNVQNLHWKTFNMKTLWIEKMDNFQIKNCEFMAWSH